MKQPTILASNQPAPTDVALRRLVRPTINYAIERDAEGTPIALHWSPAIQAAADAKIKAWQDEQREKERQARKPMSACVEWAKQHGLWA